MFKIISGVFLIIMSAQSVTIEYKLSMPVPSNHLFEVEMTLSDISDKDDYIDFVLPVWRPGRYLIFDFAGGVQNFSASSNQNNLKWHKTDKTTWRVNREKNNSVRISYKVYANDFNNRTRGLDDEHAFVDGTSVFMYVEKYRANPLTLTVIPYQNWQVTTGLENADGDDFKFTAPNVDYFYDCPLEVGLQKDYEFDVRGIKHVLSFYGEADFSIVRLIDDCRKIIEYNFDFWGRVPYQKYIFITHLTPTAGGGTEHINSTILGFRPEALKTEKGYQSFLRLISHEFFHTWNVKQLKPAGLTPYDYLKENYTGELWIAEGGTSYYDGLNVLRLGLMPYENFIKEIVTAVEDDKRRPGNRVQSVYMSSFDAWIKFWKRQPNSYNAESDYYGKGSYVSMILDLEIRNATNNSAKLDDVYKLMFERFPLDVKGYTNEDFKNTCEEVSARLHFVSDGQAIQLDEFFDDYVYGTKPIDWEKELGYAGLELKSDDSTMTPMVGIRANRKGEKIIIDEVLSGSASEKAGLMSGDEIVALDSIHLDYSEMDKRFSDMKTGDTVKLVVMRNNELRVFMLMLEDKKAANYSIIKTSTPTDLQRRIYEGWLGVKW